MTKGRRVATCFAIAVAIALPLGVLTGMLRNWGYNAVATTLLILTPIVAGLAAARYWERAKRQSA